MNDDEEEMKWIKQMLAYVEGEMDDDDITEDIWDNLTDGLLDTKKAHEARKDEMKFVKEIGVYEERDVSECWMKTGKGPIGTRWVDILKGAEER